MKEQKSFRIPNHPTSKMETILVRINEIDTRVNVVIYENNTYINFHLLNGKTCKLKSQV